MPSMKLMQILLSQSEAGAETYFEKVATAFAQDDSLEQRLIIEEQKSRESRLTFAGVDYRTLPMSYWGKKLLYNSTLKREIKRFAPDVIVTWVNRASRKCPKTDALIVGRLGGYYDINNYSKCDHLIVNTPDLVRHVTENGWAKEKVAMISNFGELPKALEVDQALPNIPTTHKVILTLGRLHHKKAQDTLIKAMIHIPHATLLIAGEGELRAKLENLAYKIGVSDRVIFLGLRKDIRQLFERADICVFPSRFEPLGNVVLEAWATETPLVAAASQGPSWLVKHGHNGLLFEIDNVRQCAEQVNLILNDQQLATKLKKNGKITFTENFSMDIIIKQYRTLFTHLLKEKSKRQRHDIKENIFRLTTGTSS